MSTTPSAPQEGQMMPTTQCRACGTDVPAGAFCGCCGAHLFQESGGGLKRSRIRAFAVAPTEHVLRLSVVTSLFPHLPHRSRAAFRVGLAILVALLVVLGLLRWQAALIAVSTLGFPLLFQLYLQECDAYGDVRTRTLLPAAVIGIGLGVGWALLTGPIVARSDVAMLGAAGWTRVLWVGLAIPLGGAMLMLVPAVIARVFRPPTRESLDGFLVGALGAIVFTAAANLTRLAPQLATGLMAKDRPVGGLLVEAGIDGVAMPLTAAAAGGLVGAALWLTRGGDPPRRRPELVAAGLAVAVVVVVYAGVGLIDVAALAPGLQLGLHLLIAAFAVLVLRFGLHTALLREAREVTRGEPVSCPHCRHVVPEMAFCPSCGVAARASSRSARTARRESAAVPIDAAAKDSGSAAAARTLLPGYVVPAAAYAVPVGRHTSAPRLLVMLGVALAILVAVTVGISALVTPAPVRHVCPPYCVRPPIGPSRGEPGADPGRGAPPGPQPPAALKPVRTYPRSTFADGGFSVAIPDGDSITKASDGVVVHFGDYGDAALLGTPAKNRTPRQVVEDYLKEHFPDASIDYEIPNAMVGYEPGYGEIDDLYPTNPNANFQHERVLVMASIKNGLALIAAANGPFEDIPPRVIGHPSGVNFRVAFWIGYYVNSFTWRGDPER